jgi:hypothetical protein
MKTFGLVASFGPVRRDSDLGKCVGSLIEHPHNHLGATWDC